MLDLNRYLFLNVGCAHELFSSSWFLQSWISSCQNIVYAHAKLNIFLINVWILYFY